MAPIVYLVTGANRGIGFGLVKTLAARDNVVVFAGVRDPTAAKELQALAAEYQGKLHVVQVVASDATGNRVAIDLIKKIAGRLDVVIANAGINQSWTPAIQTSEEELRKHFEVNVVGTFTLFKAAFPLLKASSSAPKFIMISSIGGSITTDLMLTFNMMPYSMSKLAENYLARKLHFEHAKDGLIVFPICPGMVDTAMGREAIDHVEEMQSLPTKTIDETAVLLLGCIDGATREGEGGQFLNFDGARNNW